MVGCSVVMRAKIAYLLVAMLVFLPFSLSAQSNGFLSREALDSLVNPSNSKKGVGALALSHSTIDLGEIEESDVVYFNFELKNLMSKPIAITEFRSSCGCIGVQTRPQSIDPNGLLRVGAAFSPARRSGSFSYRVNIYTDLDGELPTEQVVVKGSVVSDDKWQHLPYSAGVLRLSRMDVELNSSGQERIAVANSSSEAITITATSTVEGLVLRCEPEILQPDSEGNIFIYYRGDITSEFKTMLILEGVEASPSQRIIKVKYKR